MKLFKSVANFIKRKLQSPYDGAGHGARLRNWQPTTASINSIVLLRNGKKERGLENFEEISEIYHNKL